MKQSLVKLFRIPFQKYIFKKRASSEEKPESTEKLGGPAKKEMA